MGGITKYIAQIRRLKRQGSYFFRLAMSALEWILVNWYYIVGGLLLVLVAYLPLPLVEKDEGRRQALPVARIDLASHLQV